MSQRESRAAWLKGSVWRHRDLRVAVAARALSQLGDAVALFALTIRVHDAGAGAGGVAILLAAAAVPMVLLLGVSGHVADTVDSRKVLVASATLQLLACLALAAVDWLWATVALAMVLQTGQAFANPVWGALLPRIVGDAELGRAVAAQRGLLSVASIGGAALAGVLVGTRGASIALLVDAGTFVALILAGAMIRTRRTATIQDLTHVAADLAVAPDTGQSTDVIPGGDNPASQDDSDGADGAFVGPARARVRWWPATTAGLRHLARDRILRVLFGYLVVFVIVVESVNVAEVFLVRDAVGASATAFGIIQATAAAGALVGAWLAGRTKADRGRVRNTIVGLLVGAVAIGLAGLAPSAAWVGAGYFVIGATNFLATVSLWPMLTLRTPDRDRGKVLAAVGGVLTVASLTALGIGGVVASVYGPRVTFVAGGLAAAAVAVAAGVHAARVMVDGEVPPPPATAAEPDAAEPTRCCG